MPMTESELQTAFVALCRARSMEWPRIAKIRSYLLNQTCDIYVPRDATDEYKLLVDQARFNILPLVVAAKAQNLFVDGYRPTADSGLPEDEDSPLWEAWQANRMDARQAGLYRSAITYGAAYATVLRGRGMPVIKPWSAFRLTALYDDPCDEWPQYAMTVGFPDALTGADLIEDPALTSSATVLAQVPVRVFDGEHIYEFETQATRPNGAEPEVNGLTISEHRQGVVPVVRFPDKQDLDGFSPGKLEPLLPLQRQLHQTTFSLLMTQQYSAFRQRWATGMAIEKDENGNPREPWNAAVNAVWSNESPDARFGDFAESNLSGYLDSRDKTLQFAASLVQLPPHNLLMSGISNIGAEALAAIDAGHRQDLMEYKNSFGENVEQMLRLAGRAMGDTSAWEDTAAEVIWRDTTPRSLGQVVDALGKMAAQLEIPVKALWEMIPGVTDATIARWAEMAGSRSVVAEIEAMLDRETSEQPDTTPDVVDDGRSTNFDASA